MLNNSIKKTLQLTLSSLVLLPFMAAGASAFDLNSLKDGPSTELSAEDREIKLEGIAGQKDIDFIIESYEYIIAGLGDYQLAYVSRDEKTPHIIKARFYLEGEGDDGWDTAIFLQSEKMPKKADKDRDAYTLLYIHVFMDNIYKAADVRHTEVVKGERTPVGLVTYKYDHNSGDSEYALALLWRQVDEEITNLQFVRKNQENTKEDYDNFEKAMEEVALQE